MQTSMMTFLLISAGAVSSIAFAVPPGIRDSDATNVSQISPPSRVVAVDSVAARAPITAGELQVSSREQSTPRPIQVAPATSSADSRLISSPAQGRTAAIERVSGKDRCDPAIMLIKNRAKCENAVENHADAFAAPEPEKLSPEQALSIDLQFGQGASRLARATGGLASPSETTDPTVPEGVASVLLQPSPAPDDASSAVSGVIHAPIQQLTAPH